MKTKNKFITGVICSFMIVFCVFGLSACSGSSECTHDWGEYDIIKEATCTTKGSKERTCSKCGETQTSSISKLGHTPDDDGDCTTTDYCLTCGEVAVEANFSHVGEPVCGSKAVCEECGMEFGELLEHVYDDDGDCTTNDICSNCGEVVVEATSGHTGGTATCGKKAECEVCGMEYGELEEHEGEIIWVKLLDTHYTAYSCCYTQVTEPEAHTKVNGVCTVCNFNPTLTISSEDAVPGEQVTVVISVVDNPGITGLSIEVQFNEEIFSLTSVENGEALEGLEFTSSTNLVSGSKFLWDGVSVTKAKDGEVLILNFAVDDYAPAGSHNVLIKVKAYDNDLKSFTFVIEGGSITIQDN